MADYPAPASAPTSETRQPPATGALVAYILFGIAGVLGLVNLFTFSLLAIVFLPLHLLASAASLSIVGVIGLIIAYITRHDVIRTWVESHVSWLIRTFWWSLLWNVVAVLIGITVIGYPIALVMCTAIAIWVIYRVVRGFLLFNDRKPIPPA